MVFVAYLQVYCTPLIIAHMDYVDLAMGVKNRVLIIVIA
jgi:hypothetical protein